MQRVPVERFDSNMVAVRRAGHDAAAILLSCSRDELLDVRLRRESQRSYVLRAPEVQQLRY